MQYYDFVLAWWFNVGVDVFLCISGFLYGSRTINDIPSFINRRLRKILVPYYITFFTVVLFQYAFVSEQIDLNLVLGGIVLRTLLMGGEHLWFVPVILICYAILIILDRYKEKYVDSMKSFILFFFIVIISSLIIFDGCFSFYKTDCIICFIIGYCLGLNDEKKYISRKCFLGVILFFALIGNGIQIYLGPIKKIKIPQNMETAARLLIAYNHVFLGITIFILLKEMLDKVSFRPSVLRFLNKTDEYSYETYLVHQFVILGPFSLLNITPYFFVNLVIVISVVVILAFLLRFIEGFIIPLKHKEIAK